MLWRIRRLKTPLLFRLLLIMKKFMRVKLILTSF